MPCRKKDIWPLYQTMLHDYRAQMLSFCCRHSKSIADADMLFVAIVNDLLRCIGTLRADYTAQQRYRWLQRLMDHTLADYRKHKVPTVAFHRVPDIAVESNEDYELLEALLAHLEPDERIFIEEHLQGYTYGELAEKYGITVETARQRYHRLKNKLLTIYNTYYAKR